eukprot:s4258_g3.t1
MAPRLGALLTKRSQTRSRRIVSIRSRPCPLREHHYWIIQDDQGGDFAMWLSCMEQLILLKTLQPDLAIHAMAGIVIEELGGDFLDFQPPPVQQALKGLHKHMGKHRALLLVKCPLTASARGQGSTLRSRCILEEVEAAAASLQVHLEPRKRRPLVVASAAPGRAAAALDSVREAANQALLGECHGIFASFCISYAEYSPVATSTDA